MSWSTSSIAWPASATSREPAAELLALAGVEPGRGLVQAEHSGPGCEGAGDADELPLALGEVGGHVARASSSSPSSVERSSTAAVVSTGRESTSLIVAQADGR